MSARININRADVMGRLLKLQEVLRQGQVTRYDAADAIGLTVGSASDYLIYLHNQRHTYIADWPVQPSGAHIPAFRWGFDDDVPKPPGNYTEGGARAPILNASGNDRDMPLKRKPEPPFVPHVDFAAHWIKRKPITTTQDNE